MEIPSHRPEKMSYHIPVSRSIIMKNLILLTFLIISVSCKNESVSISEQEALTLFKDIGNVDFEDMLAEANERKKPLLIYFTGHGAVSGVKMQELILPDKAIRTKLTRQFHFVTLYTDNREKLPKNERFLSYASGKISTRIKTVGNKHSNLQIEKFGSISQPKFYIVDKDGKEVKSISYTSDMDEFKEFLKL